jgi:hypothetical protein
MATTSVRLLLPVVVLELTIAGASTASAGCTVPFRVSAGELSTDASVTCTGPWERQSDCATVRSGASDEQFYCADETLFSMYGDWTCGVYGIASACVTNLQEIGFCVQKGDPDVVELDIAEDGMDWTMSTNAPGSCDSAQAVAHLGHAAAKGSRAAVRRPAPPDRDTFVFDGSAGRVVVALAKEGTAGHTGEAAVLRVLAADDTALDEASGPLPLELAIDLSATGNVQVVIEEVTHSETGAPEAFRGHYLLSVTPDLGAEGLLLEPQPDVEP